MTKIKSLVFFALLICIVGMPALGTEVQIGNTEETLTVDSGPTFSDDILKKAEQFRNSKGENRDGVFWELNNLHVFPQLLCQVEPDKKNVSSTSLSFSEGALNDIQDQVYTGTTGQLKKEDLIMLLGEPDETRENGLMIYKLMKDSSYAAGFIPFQDSMALLGFENVPADVMQNMKSSAEQSQQELENQ